MNSFDLSHSPLTGVHLIEAGAGTGKTYTIAGLYLRLMVERGLAVDKILVVTYTKAATEELKSRIRNRLLTAKAYLSGGAGEDALVRQIVQRGIEPQLALRRIQDALVDFDRAAIFTIHGFCQRVLHHFAFETGHLFQAELAPDVQALVQEAADDFWRRHISRAPAELVRYVLDQAKGPEALAELCNASRFPRARVLPPVRKPPLTAISQWRRLAAQVHAMWPHVRDDVRGLMLSEGLSAVQYGKCNPDPENSGRRTVVDGLSAAMDQWDAAYPVFERFEKFCQSCLLKATKKKYSVPQHPFFDLCDQLSACRIQMHAQMADYLRYLKVRWLKEFERRVSEKKERENLLFFDDLLSQVHTALKNADLLRAIRMQYHAALVDEFQDTDALQYEIFTALFSGDPSLLFMIGDPKQAIYSFRGADLFSYLQAKRHAPHRYTLTSNWRATPSLIKALNTVFGRCARPFGYEQIPYAPAVAATNTGDSESQPFHLWYLTRSESQDATATLTQQEAVPRIVAAVADRIAALLADGKALPEQIAVLTRTHQQAQRIKNALARAQVPAVLHSAGSVFDTPEADELARVLQAVAMPADLRRVRAALSCDLMGAHARELCESVEAPGQDWQIRWGMFAQYRQTWLQHGFYRMFSQWVDQEGVRRRLLGLPEGERRLTNLLHLAELLHEAAAALHLGPEGVLKWLANQRRDSATAAEDAQKLRLESDAQAVRIITIHKSKGLQFDIVFCPFLWAPAKVDDQLVSFHDPEEGDRLTVAVGPGIDKRHARLALEEALAENLRLMYVALTRARCSCYMVWGLIKGTGLSAPAYLLHGPPEADTDNDWPAALKSRMAALSQAEMLAELDALARSSEGSIGVEPLPESAATLYRSRDRIAAPQACRHFGRTIDRTWRIASFTSMIANLPDGARPDYDAFGHAPGLSEEGGGPDDLFGFPKGVRAGLFFHDLLENWDVSGNGNDEAKIRGFISDKLARHGFENEYAVMIERFLKRLAITDLPAGQGQTCLRLVDVPPEKRIDEMEFYFPLKAVTSEQVKQAFKDHAAFATNLISTQVERLAFAPMRGYLKGYVDRIFEHEGRFYLVDWKSNHLGHHWSDYTPAKLDSVMAESFYFLQSHLYALALDLMLRTRLPGYDFQRHFGGIYYIFLRGIQGEASSTGIHYLLPAQLLIEQLKEVLLECKT